MRDNQSFLIRKAGELYLSGMSTRDIAPIIGVSKSTSALYVKKAGVDTDAGSRIAMKMRGKESSRKGKKHTQESRQKMSASQSGHSRNVGSKRTDEQRKKMSEKAIARWADHNAKRAAERAEEKERKRKERLMPPEERLARRKARDACKRMLRRVLTMARVRKNLPTESLLGYTKEQLRAHLESQFRDGMSWSSRDSFHIDHIIPIADFFRRGIYDPALINALSNLQVLTPEENRAKSDRIITITAQGAVVGVREA